MYIIILQGQLYSNKIKAMRCLVCVCFSKIIVCKDDVFLGFMATNCNFFVPGCAGRLRQMGLIVVELFSLVLQQHILIGGD